MFLTVSPEQLAANRANAANSTGPRTPEGKARSSQNARKHGFAASNFAVGAPSGPLEDLNEVANLLEDLVNLYHPVSSHELFALERIARAQQSILRAARLEAGFFSLCLGESFDTSGQFRIPMNSQLTEEIETCQAQAEREYRRAIEEFERLKALREELRNEPNSAETETNETTCPSRKTNANPDLQPPAPESLAPGPRPPTNGSAGPQWREASDFRHYQTVESMNML